MANVDKGKRVVAIKVSMSESDLATLKQAAAAVWPGAILTNAGIVLGMALIGADKVTREHRGKKSDK